MDALKQAIVEVSYYPVSIVLIGVGPTVKEGEEEEWAPDFSALVSLDADYERMVDVEGFEQARDCV